MTNAAPADIPADIPADLHDATVDELRLILAPAIARAAMFDGWSEAALMQAAQELGAEPAIARLAFPGGAMDMVEGWVAHVDAQMQQEFADGRLGNMPVRERIRTLVQFRLDTAAGLEESLRRSLSIQAMPQNLARTARLGWRSADAMWRLAGDTATDYNHYTKRAILGSIYAAVLAIFVADESEGKQDTRDFLDRRIEGIMRFEKAKAKILSSGGEGFDFVRFLGRLRYPQH